METLKCSPDALVSLESVLNTVELSRRPSRPPDYQAENQALVALTQELTNSPSSILQKLVDTALELCRAHSAGISLLEEEAGRKIFRWHAVAGQWAPRVWGTTTPRDYSPCGTVLDYNATLLFSNAHHYYSQFAGVQPLLVEGLLVPFYVGGTAVGTVWAIAHDETRQFDAEDQRVLESLAKFAAAAYQVRLTIAEHAKTNKELQAEIAERRRAEEALRKSEEKLREQANELEQQLIASGRLVSLGEVSASMAHEFNNPLGIIMGFVQDMLSTMDPADSNYRALQIVDEEAKRCSKIVRDLREFARPKGTEFCSISIAELIVKTLQLVENRLYKQNVTLEPKLPPDLPRIYADQQQLEQVLVNLYLNALDAMSEGGKLLVEAKIAEGDGMAPEVVITVADTGFGIAETELCKIFLPFFSAKKGKGLGLGLSICERIVKNHRGKIEVESQPGTGTTFKIYLPLDRIPIGKEKSEESATKISEKDETLKG
jgi:signal transduction histidine kinase